MSEVHYTVELEYPDGHEMGRDDFGPGTRAELEEQIGSQINVFEETDWSTKQRFDELFTNGVVYVEEGYTFRAHTVRDWVLIETRWSEQEQDLVRTAHGPLTKPEADELFDELEREEDGHVDRGVPYSELTEIMVLQMVGR